MDNYFKTLSDRVEYHKTAIEREVTNLVSIGYDHPEVEHLLMDTMEKIFQTLNELKEKIGEKDHV